MKKSDWKIISILNVNKIVIRHYKNGKTYIPWSHTTTNEDWLKWEDERFEKQKGLIKRKMIYFSKSQGVTLSNSSNEDMFVIVTSDKNKKLFELLENYRKASASFIDRIKKYMDMYIIYETYSTKEDAELKAIRHSFSHSRDRLTHKPTITILNKLFGDIKIDFGKLKHRNIYKEKFNELLNKCNQLLTSQILKKITKKPNILGFYYKI